MIPILQNLDEAFIVKDGTHDSPKYVNKDIGFPLITSKNLKNGELDFEHVDYITKTDYDKINQRSKVDRGDLLFAMIGTIGNPTIVKAEPRFAIKNVALFKPTPANNSLMYLRFYLANDSTKKRLLQKTKGGTQQFVSLGVLRKFKIKLPSVSDQIQIATILSKAENLIAQRKESIALLDDFLKSSFLEMFGDPVRNEKGWNKIKFKEAVKNENAKRIPVKQGDRDNREGIYPYYGATGIIDTIDDYKFEGEYLLIAEDGKNLLFRKKNNAFMARGRFWVNNHAHVLSFNGNCNLRYLEFFLTSIDFRPFISGIDQVKLNKENLDKIPVPYPPISLQTQFAHIVEKAEALKAQYQSSLQELENLYGSLSQKAFKGELEFSKEVTRAE